jgi:hypothetical protein
MPGGGMTSAYDTLVASYNPLGWWKLADTPPGTSPADSSSHGLTGTKHGTITFGQTGIPAQPAETAALFDGSSGYVECPLATAATSNITLVSWVNIAGNVAGPAIQVGTNNGFGIGIGASSSWENYAQGTTVVGLYSSEWMNGSTPVSLATWHMLSMVVNAAGNPSKSLDGLLVYTDSSHTPSTPTGNTWLGYTSAHSGYCGGLFAEDIVIGQALTQPQQLALFNAGTAALAAGGDFFPILATI